MGEKADADWQDGLVDRIEAALMDALCGGRLPLRQTALRMRGRSFETVELDDAGNVIEPMRCICGYYAVMHIPNCPFAYACT